jgi:hypothetical protein
MILQGGRIFFEVGEGLQSLRLMARDIQTIVTTLAAFPIG